MTTIDTHGRREPNPMSRQEILAELADVQEHITALTEAVTNFGPPLDTERSGSDETDGDSGELRPLPAWINLQAMPEGRQSEINLRNTLAIRGRALLPLVCVWFRDAYSAAEWPDIDGLEDDDISDLIRSHLGYDALDDVMDVFLQLTGVLASRAQERDREMDALRAAHPDLFGPDPDLGAPDPEWSNDVVVARNLLVSHGFAVTVPE